MANSESKSDKKATAKTAAKKTATTAKPAKPIAEKLPAAKAGAGKKLAASLQSLSAEERYRMTEVAAYFMAERNNFAGSPVEYWQAAEAQINGMLGQK